MLLSMCQSRVTIKRQTSELFDSQTASASISVSRNPNTKANVQVKITRSSFGTTGDVTVTGTVLVYSEANEGSYTAVEEVLSFTGGQDIAVTVKEYSTVETVACSSAFVTAEVTIECMYVGLDGGSIDSRYSVISSYPAQFTRSSGAFPVPRFGSYESEKTFILVPYSTSFSPQTADVVTNDTTSEKYLVVGDPLVEQVGISPHWRLVVSRDENL